MCIASRCGDFQCEKYTSAYNHHLIQHTSQEVANNPQFQPMIKLTDEISPTADPSTSTLNTPHTHQHASLLPTPQSSHSTRNTSPSSSTSPPPPPPSTNISTPPPPQTRTTTPPPTRYFPPLHLRDPAPKARKPASSTTLFLVGRETPEVDTLVDTREYFRLDEFSSCHYRCAGGDTVPTTRL